MFRGLDGGLDDGEGRGEEEARGGGGRRRAGGEGGWSSSENPHRMADQSGLKKSAGGEATSHNAGVPLVRKMVRVEKVEKRGGEKNEEKKKQS